MYPRFFLVYLVLSFFFWSCVKNTENNSQRIDSLNPEEIKQQNKTIDSTQNNPLAQISTKEMDSISWQKIIVSNSYLQQSKFDSAMLGIDEVLSFMEKMSIPNDNPTYIEALITKGSIYLTKKQYYNSIKIYEKAIINSEGQKNKLVRLYANIGMAHHNFGDYQKAIIYIDEYVRLARELDIPQFYIGYMLQFSSLSFLRMSERKKALEYANDGFDMANSVDEDSLSIGDKKRLISFYSNIGQVYLELEEFSKAKKFYLQSFNLCKKVKDTISIVVPILGLGETYFAQKMSNKASKYFWEVIEKNKNGLEHNPFTTIRAYEFLAEYAINTANLYEALEHNSSALQALGVDSSYIPEYSPIEELINVFTQRGEIWTSFYQSTDSIKYLKKAYLEYQTALSQISRLKNGIQERASKQSLISLTYPVFEQAIENTIILYDKTTESKYLQFAFNISEQSKSVVLLEHLNRLNRENTDDVLYDILEKKREIQVEIGTLRTNLHEFNHSNDLIKNTEHGIFVKKQSLDSLNHILINSYPNYYNFKYNNQLISLKYIQDTLIKDNQSLLEYFVGDSSIYAFVINKKSINYINLSKPDDIKVTVEEMLNEMYKSKAEEVSIENYSKNAYQLYQRIFESVHELISSTEVLELTIIPDDFIEYIPFDALIYSDPTGLSNNRDLNYLFDKYQISYAPSVSTLKKMKEKNSKASKGLGVFAPFTKRGYSYLINKERDKENTILNFEALPATQTFCNNMENMFDAVIYHDTLANEKAFRDNIKNFQIVHIAAHAQLNNFSNYFSFIALSPNAQSLENGLLYNEDIYTLDIDAEMVVLSACETGRGDFLRGQGVLSLGRGFSFAGAKSVVTTLWKVKNEASVTLMDEFYNNLQKGQSKDKALYNAKKKLRNDTRPSPYYWAAFIPIGDMQSVQDFTKFNYPLLIFGMVIFVLLILYLNLFRKKI